MDIDEENEKKTNLYSMKNLPKPPCPVAKLDQQIVSIHVQG
jgi:hypothetical protein